MLNNYFDDTKSLHPYTQSAPFTPSTVPPKNALRGEQPEITPGFWPCEKKGKWVQVEDHRGEEGYLNGETFTIKDVGPYPKGWSKEAPEPSPEEITAKRKAELLSRLAEIDADSVRPLRAIASGTQTEADNAKLAALDAEATILRSQLATLQS